jgi:arginase family enzyme
MSRPLILDFDGAVRLPGAARVDLREHEEAIRFACRMPALRGLRALIEPQLQVNPPVVFIGSGDFHHVSHLLIERLRERVQVVVFDNHPDNMRYPFGIHCGSWVWHVSRLPFVARVHVVGITSHDVSGLHVLENHLAALRSGRVVYWCVRDIGVLSRFGARSFPSVAAMLERFRAELGVEPVYLSIDKDVLASDVVQTNWDQGVMQLEELEAAIAMLQGRVIGSDVVGDVSAYRYKSRFKRLLSGLDGQAAIPDHSLAAWQSAHQRVNERLFSAIVSSSAQRIA